MKPAYEKGLYPAFRFLLIVQMLLGTWGVIIHIYHGKTGNTPLPLLLVGSGLALLLFWITFPPLLKATGSCNLPIALIVSCAASLCLHKILYPGQGSEEASIVFFFNLMIPLILAGWQYRYPILVIMVCIISAADVVMGILVARGFRSQGEVFYRLIVIRGIIFLLVGYIITRIMTEVRRQRTALEKANRELVRLAGNRERLAEVRERNRLARELHDTLAHTLSGLAVQLEAAESLWPGSPADAAALTSRALQTTRSGLAETRRALKAMRAEPVEELGLERALRSLIHETAERGGLSIDIEADEKIPLLGPDREQGLYRIAREALENTIRHAGATTCRMGWSLAGTRLTWEFSDNGKGFDVTTTDTGNHFGLQGIRERATLLDGNLVIESAPGLGTRLILTFDTTGGMT